MSDKIDGLETRRRNIRRSRARPTSRDYREQIADVDLAICDERGDIARIWRERRATHTSQVDHSQQVAEIRHVSLTYLLSEHPILHLNTC